jgi:Rps23 Pro-64 3,4-dihydroxylase Tpa1-like proline 4-hydroxylase
MTQTHFDSIHIIDNFIDELSMNSVHAVLSHSEHCTSEPHPEHEARYRSFGFLEKSFNEISKYSPPSITLKHNDQYPIKPVFDPIMMNTHATIQNLWDRELFIETNYSILGYRVGDSLKAHHDAIYNMPTNSGHPKRDISAVLYLNDDYEGGELNFVNQKIKIKPKAGTIVLFPSTERFTHFASKVVSGIKFFVPSLWCFK